MKHLLLALVLTCSFASFSQTVNDIPIKDINVEYIEIVGTGKLFSTKLTIQIDFGQHDKIFSAKDTQVKDEDGRLMVFNSMVDALNFFGANGYVFQQAYVLTVNNQNVYHYLMRKGAE
jgi:hypothetical protein